MDQTYLGKLYWQLTGLVMVVMLSVLGGVSLFTQQAFEQRLLPELVQKAVTVGASTRTLILRAVDYGIDYRNLYGVASAFSELRKENPEFAYLAATDEAGVVLFESGERAPGANEYFMRMSRDGAADHPVLLGSQYLVSLPIVASDRALGMIYLGIDQTYITGVMREVLLDVVVVLLVAVFFTFELLRFTVAAGLETQFGTLVATVERIRSGDFSQPAVGASSRRSDSSLSTSVHAAVARLRERYRVLSLNIEEIIRQGSAASSEFASMLATLGDKYRFNSLVSSVHQGGASDLERIRAPLFVFILAEELTRSFVPAYANYLLVDIPGLSKQMVIGLPIMLFMMIVALGQPYFGPWSNRIGRRNAMLVGAVLGTLGFVGTALAGNLYDLLFWRSVCAFGYAMVFVAAQGYVLDHTNEDNRTRGFALFVGVFMVATICGPPIGGILADNIGYRWSFAVSAAITMISIAIIMRLPKHLMSKGGDELAFSFSDFKRLLANKRFMVLAGLAAMPAKIILTGFCFYLIPLYIVSLGKSPAMAGRLLMIYAVTMVLIVPLAARIADLRVRRDRLVALGLCISGLGGLLMLLSGGVWTVFAMVLLLGLGQSLSIAAQGTLVGEFCQDDISQIGEGAVYGAYRLLERTGNVIGPLLASVLLVFLDYNQTFAVISIIVLLSGILFAVASGALKSNSLPLQSGS
jgi:MFS family permease